MCPDTHVLIMKSGCSFRHSLLSKHEDVSLGMASAPLKGENANQRQAVTYAENEGSLWPEHSQCQGFTVCVGGVPWAKEEEHHGMNLKFRVPILTLSLRLVTMSRSLCL